MSPVSTEKVKEGPNNFPGLPFQYEQSVIGFNPNNIRNGQLGRFSDG